MADQSVEVRFGFVRVMTCAEADVNTRVESARKRYEREMQLATKDNTLRLRAIVGIREKAEGAGG